jgi:hypothetical protein
MWILWTWEYVSGNLYTDLGIGTLTTLFTLFWAQTHKKRCLLCVLKFNMNQRSWFSCCWPDCRYNFILYSTSRFGYRVNDLWVLTFWHENYGRYVFVTCIHLLCISRRFKWGVMDVRPLKLATPQCISLFIIFSRNKITDQGRREVCGAPWGTGQCPNRESGNTRNFKTLTRELI